jgi:hypothetical protein
LGLLLPYCRIEKRNPAYGDSFLCSRLPLQASFAPVPEKQDMAICFESVIAREHSDRGDLPFSMWKMFILRTMPE